MSRNDAENQPYAEHVPWAGVLAPAAVLALLGALAVTTGRRGSRPQAEAAGVGSPGAPKDHPRGAAQTVPEPSRIPVLTPPSN